MWHLDIPTRDQLLTLAQAEGTGIVSLYLPTTPVTAQIETAQISFRNLMDQALEALRKDELPREDVEAVEEELAELADDEEFWAHQAYGLGVIASPTRLWTFRLPYGPAEQVYVDDRAHILPLIAAASEVRHAHVLLLSEGAARLVDVASDLAPREVPVPGLPKSLADYVGSSNTGDRTLIGVNFSAQERSEFRKYGRAVDAALRPVLLADERPLILVSPLPIGPVFRSVCTSPYLTEVGLDSNGEKWSLSEVAEAIEPVLAEVQQSDDARLAALVDERRGQDRVGVDLANIAKFVTEGRVDTLMIDRDALELGHIDAAGNVSFDDAGDPLLDELALRTLKMGGRVLAVTAERVPGETVVAILRY